MLIFVPFLIVTIMVVLNSYVKIKKVKSQLLELLLYFGLVQNFPKAQKIVSI